MPVPKGMRVGGRAKGTRNKVNQTLQRITGGDTSLSLLQGRLDQIMRNELPCTVCRGKGMTRFQPGGGKDPTERVCQSCWGSGMEQLDPELIAKVTMEEKKYHLPQRKAIEVTGSMDVNIGEILAAARRRVQNIGK